MAGQEAEVIPELEGSVRSEEKSMRSGESEGTVITPQGEVLVIFSDLQKVFESEQDLREVTT